MRIAIGCDHIVTEMKNGGFRILKSKGYEVIDLVPRPHVLTHPPLVKSRSCTSGQADLEHVSVALRWYSNNAKIVPVFVLPWFVI